MKCWQRHSWPAPHPTPPPTHTQALGLTRDLNSFHTDGPRGFKKQGPIASCRISFVYRYNLRESFVHTSHVCSYMWILPVSLFCHMCSYSTCGACAFSYMGFKRSAPNNSIWELCTWVCYTARTQWRSLWRHKMLSFARDWAPLSSSPSPSEPFAAGRVSSEALLFELWKAVEVRGQGHVTQVLRLQETLMFCPPPLVGKWLHVHVFGRKPCLSIQMVFITGHNFVECLFSAEKEQRRGTGRKLGGQL